MSVDGNDSAGSPPGEWRFVENASGARVPLCWFAAENARATLLLLPALGIRAKLYFRLARVLSEAGLSTALLEQRGHGESPYRPGYGRDFGFREYLDDDLPAALEEVRSLSSGAPLVLAGHSLGGHFSTLSAGRRPGDFAGIVHLACSFPYHADFAPRQARLIRLLSRLMPLFAVLPGYYPGDRIGFGGREYLQLMRNWCQWARTGRFDFDGCSGCAERVAGYTGPVLSIALDGDDYASAKGISRALEPFVNASVSRVILGQAEQGQYRGHADWARQPDGVARRILDWLPGAVLQ